MVLEGSAEQPAECFSRDSLGGVSLLSLFDVTSVQIDRDIQEAVRATQSRSCLYAYQSICSVCVCVCLPAEPGLRQFSALCFLYPCVSLVAQRRTAGRSLKAALHEGRQCNNYSHCFHLTSQYCSFKLQLLRVSLDF